MLIYSTTDRGCSTNPQPYGEPLSTDSCRRHDICGSRSCYLHESVLSSVGLDIESIRAILGVQRTADEVDPFRHSGEVMVEVIAVVDNDRFVRLLHFSHTDDTIETAFVMKIDSWSVVGH